VDTARRCPRCSTIVPAGKSVCQRCELSIDTWAVRSVRQGVRYNPAGLALPSPNQGHATVLVGVVIALALLGFFAFNSMQGIGPFTARVIDERVIGQGGGVTVRLEVVNDGSRAGTARCQVTGRSGDGELISSEVTSSPSIRPKRTAAFDVPVEQIRQGSPLDVRCS
jgi:hypothetical protein